MHYMRVQAQAALLALLPNLELPGVIARQAVCITDSMPRASHRVMLGYQG